MTHIKSLTTQFDRSSWITLAIAIIILIYILFPAIFTYTIPSDGWSLDTTINNGDLANTTLYFKTHLVDGPTPLQQNDMLLAIDGHPANALLSQWATFIPARPSDWVSGGTVHYSILRDGKTLDVDVPLAPLPVQALFRNALEAWNNIWLAIFMYTFFLPAMVAIGLVVFFFRPRHLAAQALLIISITFVGQLSYAPGVTGCLFYWPLSVPYGFLLNRWTSIIIPTTLLLSLAFPGPKGLLRRHLRISLVLIYLPWIVGSWAITLIKSGDLAGIYTSWIILSLVQLVLILIMAGAIIHSFRTVRGAIERAQLKWFIFGFAGFVIAGGISWIIGTVLNLPTFNTLVNYFGYLFLPLCLGIAILRYRLFDIDLIIRRTLVYSILTSSLGLVFYGGVTLLQRLFTALIGHQSPASIVISTLLIVFLFSPLRRRIQGFIDRRFYRQKYNADHAVTTFAAAARSETELKSLTGQMVKVVDETVQPEKIWVWMKDGTGARR